MLSHMDTGLETQWKWYIIREDNTFPQFWTFVINSMTFYSLFITPFVLVFKEATIVFENFELFVDICFTMDIFLNFFKLKNH